MTQEITMGEPAKTWLMNIMSGLSLSAIVVASNLYVDVQLIKKDQERLVEISAQQKQMEVLIQKLDKSLAVQAETLQTLVKAMNEIRPSGK